MDGKARTTEVVEGLFDRVEKDGMAVASVDDGTIFVFKADVLRRLLSDAEVNPNGHAVVFVRRPPGATS